MMRPSVPGPTGTEIGPPVSVTSWPRTKPSEMSIAMQRTELSPKCCATSIISFEPLFIVSSAFRMGGRSPSNFTSTTAPITCVTWPTAFATFSISCAIFRRPRFEFSRDRGERSVASERLGARYDFEQFLGDHRLARAVVAQCVFLDHFAGVSRRIVHRAHLRAEEGRGILEQGAIDAHHDRARQQLSQYLGLIRFVMIHRQQLVLRGELGRNQLLRGRNLRDHRLESGVEQRADVELAAFEQLDHLAGDRLRRLELDRANGAQIVHFQDMFFVRASKLVVALLAYAQNFPPLAWGRQSIGAIARQTHDRGVESAAEAALAGADAQKMRLIRAGSGEQARSLGAARTGAGEIGEHRLDLVGIGSRRLRGRLRAPQFRNGDHLHRLGDLLRRPDGGDPVSEVLEGGHLATLDQLKLAANASTAVFNFAAVASVRSREERIVSNTSASLPRM